MEKAMMYGLLDKEGLVSIVVDWDGVSPHNDAKRLVKLPEGKTAAEWIGKPVPDEATVQKPKGK